MEKEPVARPVVIYISAFKDEILERVSRQISEAHTTGQPIIPIVIDAFGGCPYALLSLLNLLETATLPIATIVEGKAMSCGAVLFAMGTPGYRYIGKHGIVMIHDVSTNYKGKTLDAVVDARESERLNQTLCSLLDRAGKQLPGFFGKLIHENGHADLYLTPEQCLEYNLGDYIGVPTLKTEVQVSFNFGLQTPKTGK